MKPDPYSPEGIAMRAGIGNWDAFKLASITVRDVLAAAEGWASELNAVERPWLCWNVDHDWCVAQQRLVEHVGWTPLVGFDPRVGRPPLTKAALCIDFNEKFGFPTLYPHFVIEFAFAFAPRLAFWHSDLLLRKPALRKAAHLFEQLTEGAMAATQQAESRLAFLHPRLRRYWELLGCMTRGASRANFDTGCGWWLNFWEHPNCPSSAERHRRRRFYWECGTGIRYWHKHCGGKVRLIQEHEIGEGHFTRIGNPSYKSFEGGYDWRRNLGKELALNFELARAARQLEIEDVVLL
jgi:hypothetical protein